MNVRTALRPPRQSAFENGRITTIFPSPRRMTRSARSWRSRIAVALLLHIVCHLHKCLATAHKMRLILVVSMMGTTRRRLLIILPRYPR